MSLSRGSADFLDITNPSNYQYSILREYLIQQGDRTVHFSGFCSELASTPIVDATQRKFLSWSPLQRTLAITSHAIMYVPRTSEQSGIFFDCRVLLDDIAQVIVLDSEEYGKVAQIFVKTKDARTAVSLASPFPNLAFAGQQIACTLMFQDASVRKSMLMALCTVRPQMPILQKKSVAGSGAASSVGPSASSPRTPKGTSRALLNYDIYQSPGPNTPSNRSGKRGAHTVDSASRGGGRFPQAKSFGTLATFAAMAASKAAASSSLNTSHAASYSDGAVMDYANMTDEEFRAEQARLQDELLLSHMETVDEYDADAAAARPAEEDPSRLDERDAIRALLETRERKMCQHIEFRMKYPTKVATRVQPGVEYDKAHEERRLLPDDHGDEELLGPSLAPLWWRWKLNGGLDGLSKRSDAGRMGGAPDEDDWSIFDSAELIDSLKAREEIVYGQVGPKSQARLQRMRELVQRELHMHKNRLGSYGLGKSPSRSVGSTDARHAKVTVPIPFSLSQSPVTLRRMKMVDADKLITDLRQSFDKHQQAVHQIRKAQLQREVQRAQGE